MENLDKELVSASARISMSKKWRKRDPRNQRLRIKQNLEKIKKEKKQLNIKLGSDLVGKGEFTCLRN